MTNDTQNTDLLTAVNSHPTGRGLRPTFEALWHLEALKVVDDLSSFSSDAWDMAENTRHPIVVVMDTPMDIHHSNLKNNIDFARMRDFSVYNDGAFPVSYESLNQDEKNQRIALEAELQIALEAQQQDNNEESNTNLISCIASSVASEIAVGKLGEEARAKPFKSRELLAKQLPGAHGTAVAGLVAGYPATEPLQTAAYLGATNTPSETIQAQLPYAGINPFATIIPISLTAAPYPDMVLGALTYIEAIKPDIVVIAAAWAESTDLTGVPNDDESWAMALNDKSMKFVTSDANEIHPTFTQDAAVWASVTNKIKSISNDSIVLCAAGNVDSNQLVYPANLCTETDNNLWAVTACDVDGEKLSYAPRIQENARMIKTLSTQLPRADQVETVIDPYTDKLDELNVNHIAPKFVSPRDIITLDPGGSQGYNPTEFSSASPSSEEPLLEIGSLYARFSGTSAATAIAGGLASLALSMGAKAAVGVEADNENLFDLDQARALFGLKSDS